MFESEAELQQHVQSHWNGADAGQWKHLPAFLHVLTHKDLHLHPVLVPADKAQSAMVYEASEACWADAAIWAGLGLPAPIRKLLDAELS